MTMMPPVSDEALDTDIRQILRDHARLTVDASALDQDSNLFQAGMSSHASVNVMIALEDKFEIEFPDSLLKRSSFETIDAIAALVAQLRAAV
jgi:acyl carrier protein